MGCGCGKPAIARPNATVQAASQPAAQRQLAARVTSPAATSVPVQQMAPSRAAETVRGASMPSSLALVAPVQRRTV